MVLGRKRTFVGQMTLEKVTCRIQCAEATNFKDLFMVYTFKHSPGLH